MRTPQLHLILPEGREETLAAKLGQTVQYTKAVLHERFEVPIDQQVCRHMSLTQCLRCCNKHLQKCFCLAISLNLHALLQTLLFDGKPMLDPLSLADCKGISCGGQNLITVQVLVLVVALLPQVCAHVLTHMSNAGQQLNQDSCGNTCLQNGQLSSPILAHSSSAQLMCRNIELIHACPSKIILFKKQCILPTLVTQLVLLFSPAVAIAS